MSMHKIPLSPLEEEGLRKHGLKVDAPSQASDCFRQGVAWALSQHSAPLKFPRQESSAFKQAADLLQEKINAVSEIVADARQEDTNHVPTLRIQPAPAGILPAAPRPVWLDPAEYPPPSGKLHILTGGGIATTGHWDDKDCVAWMPLADTPDSVKQRINNWYRKAGQPQ